MTTRARSGPTMPARCVEGWLEDEGHRDQGETLERDPHERAGREMKRMVRSDEGGPDEQ